MEKWESDGSELVADPNGTGVGGENGEKEGEIEFQRDSEHGSGRDCGMSVTDKKEGRLKICWSEENKRKVEK